MICFTKNHSASLKWINSSLWRLKQVFIFTFAFMIFLTRTDQGRRGVDLVLVLLRNAFLSPDSYRDWGESLPRSIEEKDKEWLSVLKQKNHPFTRWLLLQCLLKNSRASFLFLCIKSVLVTSRLVYFESYSSIPDSCLSMRRGHVVVLGVLCLRNFLWSPSSVPRRFFEG